MTAPTVAVEWLLARAAARGTGLLHVVSRRDSGALNPICGANPVRSASIDTFTALGDTAELCPGCATMATSIGGTVRDGVALLLGLSAAQTTTRLLELPIGDVRIRRGHARRSPGDLVGLRDSILERGIVMPIVVRRSGPDTFEVIDGARRLAAAHHAGLTSVPAVVRDATDSDALVDALTANVQRQDLNPIDLAHAYQHACDQLGVSKAELGRRLGIDRSTVSNTIRLLDLDEFSQQRVADGKLTAQDARRILAGEQPGPKGLNAAKPVPLPDVSGLLEQLLAATVRVTARGDKTRITIDCTAADADRVISLLGTRAAAA